MCNGIPLAASKNAYETVAQWAARVKNLGAKCKFGKDWDQILTDKFISGFEKGEILDKFFELEESVTFDKAILKAMKKEVNEEEEEEERLVSVGSSGRSAHAAVGQMVPKPRCDRAGAASLRTRIRSPVTGKQLVEFVENMDILQKIVTEGQTIVGTTNSKIEVKNKPEAHSLEAPYSYTWRRMPSLNFLRLDQFRMGLEKKWKRRFRGWSRKTFYIQWTIRNGVRQ
ncbi:uncharacterized protein LOC111693167 [Anoplophora glabripennis]|uniref:uncharacterized protein LOC111693167 n=1 Tax=Anoplophora glabripennis TaxID=217634 RepID=UPI000C777EB0|nr:uncharacterized protein LOC111693167 [Anoplophora glabripennis]